MYEIVYSTHVGVGIHEIICRNSIELVLVDPKRGKTHHIFSDPSNIAGLEKATISLLVVHFHTFLL